MNDQELNDTDIDGVPEEEVEEWFDSEDEGIEVTVTPEDALSEKYTSTQLRVVRSTLDFTLHTLKSALSDPNYINFSPSYQRRGRWDRKKRSLLIESFLLNVPIPPLFLFENDYNQYEVMDGRQRLDTIAAFLENDFPLTGLEFWPELQGKRFRDLPGTIQRGLLRRTISAVVLLAETAKGDEDFDIRMVLFRRLNTGGINLNPQELRNALYPGGFNNLLRELSRYELFTMLWRIPPKSKNEEEDPPASLLKNTLYKAMMDCELVLRFFAIRETVLGDLKGSLRHILDKTMKNKQAVSTEEIDRLKELFLNTLQRLINALGKDFILLPGTKRPSRPLYDALMVATSMNQEVRLDKVASEITARLGDTLANPEKYDVLVGRGNTVDAIKDRVALAKYILLG